MSHIWHQSCTAGPYMGGPVLHPMDVVGPSTALLGCESEQSATPNRLQQMPQPTVRDAISQRCPFVWSNQLSLAGPPNQKLLATQHLLSHYGPPNCQSYLGPTTFHSTCWHASPSPKPIPRSDAATPTPFSVAQHFTTPPAATHRGPLTQYHAVGTSAPHQQPTYAVPLPHFAVLIQFRPLD